MPTITAQTIVDRAEKTLLDDTNVRWAEAELLEYLNDAQRHIVMLKPDAYTKNTNIQMAASETKNTIPADAIRLKRPVRNMGALGTSPGRAIIWANIDQLDKSNPDWHTDTASAVIQHFLADQHDPKTFYVYPPQPATGMGYAEIIYFATPADIAIGATILLDDVYQDPMYFYVLSRAHSKETPEASDAKAGGYYTLFLQSIGLKTQGEQAVDAGKAFA